MEAKTLLIDGDIIAYQSCVVVEKECDWGDGVTTLHSTLEDAWAVTREMIADLAEQADVDPDDVVFAFSDSRNWRKELWDGYKAHRKKQRKPLAYGKLVEHIKSLYRSFQYPWLEADDVLGILMTDGTFDVPVLWSLDKDLKQIPGLHLIDDEIVEITKEEGDVWWWKQALMGDASDGYKGCPGIGEKKADGLIKDPDSWNVVKRTFLSAKQTEQDALLQARLSRILRHGDYDFKKEKVLLWKP